MRAIPILLCLAASLVCHADEEEVNGFFGVSIHDVGKILAINSVYEGTSAKQYGAKHGDLIVAINGEVPGSTQQMIQKVTTKPKGTAFTFRILRGDREFDMKVKLGARPAEMTDAGHGMTPAQKARLDWLGLLRQQQGSPVKAVYGQALARIRKADDQADARAYAAIYRAMVRAEHQAAKKADEKARWATALRSAEWLLTLARAAKEVPENTGRVANDDAALQRRIEAALGKLGDARWAVREQACATLYEIGEPAMKPAQRHADKAEDPEVAWRAKQVADAIAARLQVGDGDWGPAIREVTDDAGKALATRGVLGPELKAGARYRVLVLRKTGDAWKTVGVLTLTADADGALSGGKDARVVAKGDRLGYLAPRPRKKAPKDEKAAKAAPLR